MKAIHRGIIAIVFASMLVVCLAIPAALAAPATSAWINGVMLDAGTPYWKNDNTTYATEPASGWNAYFNAATGTLTLNNATITAAAPLLTSHGLVCADGDLSLVLRGASTISWDNNTYDLINGIVAGGTLAISGDGSVNIQIRNTAANGSSIAVLSYGNMAVASGSISSTLRAENTVYGLYALGNILFAGGQTVIDAKAPGVTGVMATSSEFRMTGGSITVNAEGTAGIAATNTHALFCATPVLEGGSGSFTVYGLAEYQSGLYYNSDTLSYSGGTFIFAGSTSALLSYGSHASLHYNLNNAALVYASKYTDGRSPILWKSDADGILTSLLLIPSMSDFKYVRFTQPVDQPQTGDRRTPWLWMGIALCVLLGMTGRMITARRKCR